MARNLASDNWLDTGTLVKAFTDLSGYGVTASPTTKEISTDFTLTSSASLHIVTAVAATTEVTFTGLSYDFKHRMFGWWVYVPDYTKIASFLPYVGTTGYAAAAATTYDITGTKIFARNGWHFVAWGHGQWSADIGELLQAAKLRIIPAAGEAAEVYIDSAWMGMRARPRLVFLFDDGKDSQYTYRAIMNDRNIKAGYGYIRGQVGASTFMTRAELDEMYADGHDMVVHGGTDYTSLTTAELHAEIRAAQKELTDNGYGRGVHALIYPFGSTNKEVMDVVGQYFSFARSTDSPSHGNYGYGIYPLAVDPATRLATAVVGWTNNSTVAEVKGQIDSLVKTGQDGFAMLHGIVDSGATDILINDEDLEEIADHAILRQNQGLLNIVSPSEYIAGYARSIV